MDFQFLSSSFNSIDYQAAFSFGLDFYLAEQSDLMATVDSSVRSTKWAIACEMDASEFLPLLGARNKAVKNQAIETEARLNALKHVAQEASEQQAPCELFDIGCEWSYNSYPYDEAGLDPVDLLNDGSQDDFELAQSI